MLSKEIIMERPCEECNREFVPHKGGSYKFCPSCKYKASNSRSISKETVEEFLSSVGAGTPVFKDAQLQTWLHEVAGIVNQPLVYRAYKDDDLLYVGVTSNLTTRLTVHRSSSEWASNLTHVLVNAFNTFWEAEIFEALVCGLFEPTYNKTSRFRFK